MMYESELLNRLNEPLDLQNHNFCFEIGDVDEYDEIKSLFTAVGFKIRGQMSEDSHHWEYPDRMGYRNTHYYGGSSFDWGESGEEIEYKELCDFLSIKFCEYCGENEKNCICDKEERNMIDKFILKQ